MVHLHETTWPDAASHVPCGRDQRRRRGPLVPGRSADADRDPPQSRSALPLSTVRGQPLSSASREWSRCGAATPPARPIDEFGLGGPVTTLNPAQLTAEQLAPMLRSWADGLPASEAAVDLLIRHDTWLRREDFRTALVDAVDSGWGTRGTTEPLAAVDWDGVEGFLDSAACSRSEAGVLRLAASLAGAALARSLAEMTCGLDEANADLVLQALAHRFGWHERGRPGGLASSGTH